MNQTRSELGAYRSGASEWLARSARYACGALILAGLYSQPGKAQSFLLGNPQISSTLTGLGNVIQPSIRQTATTSTITYTVTPTPTGLNAQVGRLNWTLAGPGIGSVSTTFTVTWTGPIAVEAYYAGGNFHAGYVNGGSSDDSSGSPQTVTRVIAPCGGYFSFLMYGTESQTATITVQINVGSSGGARKPYLNDFLGFGFTNYTVFRPQIGTWFYSGLNESTVMTQWGLPGDAPVAADYDGDGLTDYAVWRPASGTWYIISSRTGAATSTQFGLPGDIPMAAGDYDGDGIADLSVFRPYEGNWYIRLSSGGVVVTNFGIPGDIPVVGDFDGDGKTDRAVFRPSEGNWYVLPSSTLIPVVTQFGLPGDIPVPSDYDRDGKTDLAVWRPSTGTWYVLPSAGGSISTIQFGLPGDDPIPGDYNGDGLSDFAIWRPSTGQWWVYINGLQSSAPIPIQWGNPGDIPVGQTLTFAP